MPAAKLVLTHGTTDLQILLRDDQERLWRASPDKALVRRFHAWLLEHKDHAEVIALPDELQSREREATFTDFQDESFALWLRDSSPDSQPHRDSNGRLQLVLPKIENALTAWLQRHTGNPEDTQTTSPLATAPSQAGLNKTRMQSVLVLSTDRGDTREGEQEPVATFTFLKEWLASTWSIPASAIREEVFLGPGQRLEGSEGPVAPKVAERIERAVRSFYDQNEELAGSPQSTGGPAKKEKRPTLLIGSMGGMPQIKPLLAEIAVLLTADQAESLFKTEHGAAGLISNSPIDTLRVRRQCLEHVRSGALLEAWIMATPCHNDPDARLWVRPLEEAANLINGNPIGENAKLPALQEILQHGQEAACLLVAIRIEAALRSQRWLEAINGTITFLEAALHDGINLWAKSHLDQYDPRRRYMRFMKAPPWKLEGSKAIAKWEGRESCDLSYQSNTVGDVALSAWSETLDIAPFQDLRNTIHDRQTLSTGTRFKLADYRNYNTHGVMTQEEIDEAIKRFMGTNLWSQGVNNLDAQPRPGNAFINRPLIKAVIQHFIGEDNDPAVLYQELLRQLENQLIDPGFYPA